MLNQTFVDANALHGATEIDEYSSSFHSLLKEGRHNEARECLNYLERKYPFPFVFKNLYSLSRHASDSEMTLESVRKLYEVDSSLENKYLLASTIASCGDEREALSLLNQIIYDVDANSKLLFICYHMVANIYMRAGDLDGAEECLHKANRLQPSSLELMISYGYLYFKMGFLEKAKQHFAEAIRLDKSSPQARAGLGLLYASVGEYDVACANLEFVLESPAVNLSTLKMYFEWSEQVTDKYKACYYIERYLSVHPKSGEAYSLLLSWYIKRDNLIGARRIFAQFKKYYKGNQEDILEIERHLRGKK